MRFHPLSLSLAVALTLSVAPAAARAQVVVRGQCYGRWDYCDRRDDIERLAHDRALDRAAKAQERALRLDDARRERQIRSRFEAEARADARAASVRDSELRAQERQDRAIERREQAQRNRELRIRTYRFRE
jgi:hypothetical protein